MAVSSGQTGQANYVSANTFLDSFVQYRASLDLPCTAIDIGAMDGVGYLSENPDLLRKMQGTGWCAVQEAELLEALNAAMLSPSARSQQHGQSRSSTGTWTDRNNFLLGISPAVSLSSPDSSARLRKDARMAVYHNMSGNQSSKAGSSSNDSLHLFLNTIKKDMGLLQSSETQHQLAVTVVGCPSWEGPFSLLLKWRKSPSFTAQSGQSVIFALRWSREATKTRCGTVRRLFCFIHNNKRRPRRVVLSVLT